MTLRAASSGTRALEIFPSMSIDIDDGRKPWLSWFVVMSGSAGPGCQPARPRRRCSRLNQAAAAACRKHETPGAVPDIEVAAIATSPRVDLLNLGDQQRVQGLRG
jgi:hypothetical protein